MEFSETPKTPTLDGPQDHHPHQFHQNVIVMRHGERIDHAGPMWVSTAARPWDPPLVDAGRVRAFCTVRKLRIHLGFPAHRVFVSPFLRCIQTASEVVSALCAVEEDPANMTGDGVSIDPSKLKLPQWEETVMGARARYAEVIQALADKYPSENLLLVTHGAGVRVAVDAFSKYSKADKIAFCAYAHLRRSIFFGENQSFTAGNFEVLTHQGKTGISYSPWNCTDDV